MRAFINLCFQRPVGVTAVYILLMVLAAVAYVRLPIALLPDIRFPTLAIWTAYPDVPPERVERSITERIEEAVAGTQGVRRSTARSLLGGSLVQLDFGWNTNLDLAMLEVREQLDRLGEALPDEAERPLVLRVDPNDRPILLVALREPTTADVRGSRDDLVALKQLGRDVIVRRLEQLDAIARVTITGGYERRIEVRLDADRLATHDIGLQQVSSALQQANVALPGGMIRRGPFRYAVEVSGEFQDLDDIADTIIGYAGRAPIRLREVAEVREGVEDRRGMVRLNGDETLLLLVERKPDANTVEAAAAVRQTLAELEAELPRVQLDVVVDESQFIQAAIGGVSQSVWFGGCLAIIVLFIFLRRWRVMVAVAVAVPLSLGVTLVLFDAFDVSFNLISLSGLALGVGMLVDNAIVVVENIARLREQGLGPIEAAKQGVVEVAGAITASTLTTIAVFLPLTFVEGLAGRLFRDQSLAVVCSLIASLGVALTVVPLLAAKDKRPSAPLPSVPQMGWGMRRYDQALRWALAHRGVVLSGTLLLLLMSGWVGWYLPREVVPKTDQGRVDVHLTLPPDADLPLLSTRADDLTRTFEPEPGVRFVLEDLGERDEARLVLDPRPPYEGNLLLILEDGFRVDALETTIAALAQPSDVTVEVKPVKTQLERLLAADEADLFIDLITEQRTDAEAVADRLLLALQNEPALANVRFAEVLEVPAYRLHFQRDAMMRFGVTAPTLAGYLEAAARGRHATELRTINEEIPIVLRSSNIDSIERLLQEQVPTPNGLFPLRTFIEAEFITLPASLFRSDQKPILRILADIALSADLAAAERAIQALLAQDLPPQVRGQTGGANDAFRDSLQAVGWSLLISVLLVYLILAAQFESLLQPLIILFTVPLAAAGVALVLWVTGQSINLMSLTGCVVLVGIVVNDAIVKVDFINQRREQGLSLHQAILEAGHDRARPILMTTLTTMLGLLPLALGFGDGAELRAPLAIAIVGGIGSATALTLFVVPVLYRLLLHKLSK